VKKRYRGDRRGTFQQRIQDYGGVVKKKEQLGVDILTFD